MKKRIKNKTPIIVVVAIVVIAVIAGIGIKIYYSSQTKTYTFPENFVDYAGLTIEQQIEDINEVNRTEDICTHVYKNKDGSFSIKLNKKQWNWWINNIKDKIKQSGEVIAEKGGKLTVSNNRESVIFEVPSGFSPEFMLIEVSRVTVCAAEYQILTKENQDREIYLCFKNMETGEIIAEGTLPYDTIEFTDEDLE